MAQYNNHLAYFDSLVDDETDVYGRKLILSQINAAIDENINGDHEYIYNVLDMVEQYLFHHVATGEVKQQEDFDLRVELILDYIKSHNIFYENNPIFEDIYAYIKREIELMKSGAKGVKGIAVCPNCKMDNIIIFSKQRTRADEGETVFHTCADCGKKWT